MSLSYTPVGDPEGTEFSYTRIHETTEHAQLVSRIETWLSKPEDTRGDPKIVGLRITYHGGSRSGIFGESDGPVYVVEMGKGERVTRLQFYGFVLSYSVFGFSLETDWGRVVNVPPQGPSVVMAVDVPVASGLLVGVGGCVDDWSHDWDVVIGFGFYFLANPAFVHVDFEYLSLPESAGIQMRRLETVEGDNSDGSGPKEVDISRTENVSNSAGTEEEWADGLGVDLTVSMGFCDIVEGPEYKNRGETAKKTSYEVSHDLSWSGHVTVPPNKHYLVELVYYEGKFSVEYKARVKYVTAVGEEIKWTEKGTMTGVSRGAAKITTKDITTQDKVKKMMGDQERQLTLRQMPPNTRPKHKCKRKSSGQDTQSVSST